MLRARKFAKKFFVSTAPDITLCPCQISCCNIRQVSEVLWNEATNHSAAKATLWTVYISLQVIHSLSHSVQPCQFLVKKLCKKCLKWWENEEIHLRNVLFDLRNVYGVSTLPRRDVQLYLTWNTYPSVSHRGNLQLGCFKLGTLTSHTRIASSDTFDNNEMKPWPVRYIPFVLQFSYLFCHTQLVIMNLVFEL